MEELQQQVDELKEQLNTLKDTYASQEYVRAFVNTYIGISMRPYTIETPIHGYIPLQIGEVIPFIYQKSIQGFTWKRILSVLDRVCLEHNVNPYIVVGGILRLTQFGRETSHLDIATKVYDGSIEQLAKKTIEYYKDKRKIAELEHGTEIAHIANRLRGIKY